MHETLSRNMYLVKEHVGTFKAANNYDIHEPETGMIIMKCREERLSLFSKILRFTDLKTMTPFDIRIRTPGGRQVVRITRGVSIFLSTVRVLDGNDRHIGGFKQEFFSIGGAFTVCDAKDVPLFQLQGKWTGWDFRFLAGNRELAHVTKKWAGIGKEFFTSADNYILRISDDLPADDVARLLILSAVMCIDMVLKE